MALAGFTMYKDAPVVYRSSEEVRETIIDWVGKRNTIYPGGQIGGFGLRPKAIAVFTGRDECLYHLGVDEVAVELI